MIKIRDFKSPNRILAKQRMVVVFPVPGGPDNRILGKLPVSEKPFNLSIISSLPTISSNTCGRNFSTLVFR